ncbi:MAG TPA: MarR family transcriptional regulator [Verrucomicrobiae bacterium]|nr:MarR family transcriptional regulator [Verrucomicrobiae bacterium]
MDPPSREPTPPELVWRGLLRIFGLLRQVMEPYFAQYGISGPQWGILRVLHRSEAQGRGSLRITDLGQLMLIRPPSVTGAIDRLERRGLVQRNPSKDDRRVRRVSLTPSGRKLVKKILTGHVEHIQSLFAGFDSRDLDTFRNLLDQLETDLQARVSTLPSPPSGTRTDSESGD